jgi:hypothetical protein
LRRRLSHELISFSSGWGGSSPCHRPSFGDKGIALTVI